MKTAIAISAMMRNVLSVAKIPPATVAASQMARIAPMIVPMIRPMYPVCARFCWQAAVVQQPAVSARAGAVRAAWHIWRDGAWPQAVTCLVGAWHVMTVGLRDVKVNENRSLCTGVGLGPIKPKTVQVCEFCAQEAPGIRG